MKIFITCKQCDKEFNRKVIIDGREHLLHQNRKRCLECSPFDKNRTYKPIDIETPRKCENCEKLYIYDRNQGHRKKLCNSCKTTASDIKKKERCIEYKGGKCQICNYNRYRGALVFHHLDSNEKDFNIGQQYSRSWEVLTKELDKCALLCQNCHQEVHAGIVSL